MKDSPPPAAPKRRCTVLVSEAGWLGSKAAAQALGCGSISDLLEKLGRGELAVVPADELGPPLADEPASAADTQLQAETTQLQPEPTRLQTDVTQPRPAETKPNPLQQLYGSFLRLPKLALTASCATLILLPILYVLDLRLSRPRQATVDLAAVTTLTTGDTVAGYEVTDHMRIRPVHPVTGATNVPHNGVDVATPTGTPVYAVGVAGDRVTVSCWWDVDGGGWVADQTTESYPNLVYQSLHLLENECRTGEFTSGEVIALTGNSGLGSGEHYDFRVKMDDVYIDPPRQFLEAALTGRTLLPDGTLAGL